jgi:hypothetical protein
MLGRVDYLTWERQRDLSALLGIITFVLFALVTFLLRWLNLAPALLLALLPGMGAFFVAIAVFDRTRIGLDRARELERTLLETPKLNVNPES